MEKGERSRRLVVGHDPRLQHNAISISPTPPRLHHKRGKKKTTKLTQAMGSYSDNSSGANQSPISLVADSKASEAWIKFRPTETAYWPRTEPASASSGLVAPTIRRLGGFSFFFPFYKSEEENQNLHPDG